MIITIGTKIKDGNQNTYILDQVLGQGGFGCVYKAHRETDGQVFAVKTLLASFESPDTILSFQKEIAQAELISSEHVIKYIYVHDGTTYSEYPPYIIMEYADGGTLADLIDGHRTRGDMFELDFICDAIRQLSDGMKEISKYIVHRDIKPENILIKDGVLKISDFGLSKFSNDSTNTITFKGYGTARYVAPEGWINDKNTIQMDIYSMGIVFYEIATLNYPYPLKQNPDLSGYRNAHLYKAADNPTKFNRALPQNIVSVIIKMLEKPTQKRFDSWDSIITSVSIIPPSEDILGAAVTRALAKRNETDLMIQKQRAEQEQARKEREDYCDLIYSQYESAVFAPIENFMESFNGQYPGDIGFRVSKKGFTYKEKFSFEIATPSTERITIETEVIFAENFRKQVPTDRVFGGSGYRFINYIPKCQNREVLAWSQVTDANGKGFNLLLLKNEDSLYGDWFVLTNTNTAFNRSRREEPFGFTLKELPKEIVYINVTHIYDLKLTEFNETVLFDFLADHA